MSDPRRHDRALDPERDPVRWEEMVRSITAAAEPELARRASRADPFVLVAGWTRPLVAAAAVLALVASATLLSVGRTVGGAPSEEATRVPALSEALVPSTVAAWLEGGRAPTPEELVLALEEGQ